MKDTGSPDSNHKVPELTPELTRFIESMGTYFESYGIPRIGGRILGLLLVAHESLSAEDISALLRISRASVSTNFRLLLASGLAEKVSFPGSRTTYFSFPETAWEKSMNAEIQGIGALKRIAQQGLRALSPEDFARQRMEDLIDWADFLHDVYQRALIEWREKAPRALPSK
jgi:DNA-binding transcriptional regulator GbsR (MarR family)